MADLPPARAARTPRALRRLRDVLLALLGLIFLAWLILFVTKGRFLKHPFERFAGARLHRTVRIAGDFQLYFDPIDLKLLGEGVTISNPAWAGRPILFRAPRIALRAAPLSLLFGPRWHLRFLDVRDGAVDLEWNAAHTRNSWTFGDGAAGKPFQLPVIDRATLAGTAIRYLDPRMQFLARLGFPTIVSRDARIGAAIDFRGDGRLRETPFTVTGALLSPDATVARGRNRLTLHAVAARDIIDVEGTLPSLADVERVPLAVRAHGRNMAELLGIIGIVVPETRGYRLAAQLVKDGDYYHFTRLGGRFGDSDIAGAFTVHNAPPRVHVDADLTTRRLDIVDVAPFIGYNPDLVAAVGVKGAVGKISGVPRLLPDATLRVEALRNFDADARYRVGIVRSRNVPLSNIDLTVKLDDSLLTLSPLALDMARGHVNADIVIDARRRPAHTRYDIRLAPTPLGRLLAGFGAIEAGTTGVVKGRIRLEGDGDTVHDSLSTARGRMAFTLPGGTFWMRNVQLAELDFGVFLQRMIQKQLKKPVRINCGLVAFTVRDGIAAADPVLIDTSANVITGRGGFSFRTEALDMAFRADAKKFSLLSGQSPIGLGGHFAAPTINPLSKALLARAGVGIGLAILFPPAAVLAFVDPGDAKSAACGPVLAGADARAQRTSKGAPRHDLAPAAPGRGGKPRRKFLGIF